MDQEEISNLWRGPSIDASYQVSSHLAKWFQRKRFKCEKLTDRRQTTDAKWWQKLTWSLVRWAKNEKKIFNWIDRMWFRLLILKCLLDIRNLGKQTPCYDSCHWSIKYWFNMSTQIKFYWSVSHNKFFNHQIHLKNPRPQTNGFLYLWPNLK